MSLCAKFKKRKAAIICQLSKSMSSMSTPQAGGGGLHAPAALANFVAALSIAPVKVAIWSSCIFDTIKTIARQPMRTVNIMAYGSIFSQLLCFEKVLTLSR